MQRVWYLPVSTYRYVVLTWVRGCTIYVVSPVSYFSVGSFCVLPSCKPLTNP